MPDLNPGSASKLDSYLPRLDTVVLMSYIAVFAILPIVYQHHGFNFVLGTLLFIIGLQPHVHKLSQEGHTLDFTLRWRKKPRHLSIRFHISSEKWANRLVGGFAIVFVFLIVPIFAIVIQQQGLVFMEGIQANKIVLLEGLNGTLDWVREKLPTILPEGDAVGLISSLFGQLFGDITKVIMAASGTVFKISGIAAHDWLLLLISAIVFGVLIANWDKEVKKFRSVIQRGISHDGLRYKVIRLLELYQVGLSILMVGYIEVALTLTFIYALFMIVLPFNMGLGAIILISVILGFITAVWKIGGIAAKFLGPLFIILNLNEGIGWFGFEIYTGGIWFDVMIKAVVMFFIAFFAAALEAYNFTPEKVGARLNLTKMEMVITILIWAIGGGFFGMIWGVLALLVYQAIKTLRDELANNQETGSLTSVQVLLEDVQAYGEVKAYELAKKRQTEGQVDETDLPLFSPDNPSSAQPG